MSDPVPAMTRSRGFSPARLPRVTAVMRGYGERGMMAGAVIALSRRGDVHVEAIGAQEGGAGIPMQRNTIFRIASMTKPVAAAAAMMLVEEAKLRLDDPVDRFLPELADRRVLKSLNGPLDDTVPAKRPITLRDLLTMCAGFGMIMEPSGDHPIQKAVNAARIGPGVNPPPHTPDALMKLYAALPLMHQPGEKWMYHSSYDILGVLVARAAGMPFEAFLAERLFMPLGMKDTGFSVPDTKRDRLATGYEHDEKAGRLVVSSEADVSGIASGSAGLVSTADDYLAFGRMMLRGGQHEAQRILARPTVEVMTTDQVTPAQKAASPFVPGFWDNRGWGFGVSMTTRRDSISASPGRYGWDGGFCTSWWCDPREDLVAILLAQRLFDSVVDDIFVDFATLVYQAIDD